MLLFMTFDGLGSSVRYVFEHLECGVGGVMTAFSVLWGGLTVGTGVSRLSV